MAAVAKAVSPEMRITSVKDIAPLAGNLVAYRTNLYLFGRKEYTLSGTCFGYIVKEPGYHKVTKSHSVEMYRLCIVVLDSEAYLKDPHCGFPELWISDYALEEKSSWLYMKVATKTEQASIRNAIFQGHAALGHFPKDKALEVLSQ